MPKTSLVFALLLAACGSSTPQPKEPTKLETASTVPSAQGEVLAESAGNGNVKVTVKVKHLAPPSKVATGATTYVVWVKSGAADGKPQNIGALQPNDALEGQLSSITTLPEFDVMVTAEASASVQSPSENTVFTGHASAK